MKLHFVGVGGSGILGVSQLAAKMGHTVTGCDLEGSSAYSKNILKGHDPKHIKNVDLVITSPALYFQDGTNPEILLAQREKKLVTWQEFLGKTLLKDKKIICIAGTHGKSTTTAMAGKLLEDVGLDPIVVLGAYVPEWGGNFRFGHGEYAAVEADEFNNNFLNYKPDIAIINNIEFDHPDFFKNESDVLDSFNKFIDKLKPNGLLILNWNDKGIQKSLLKKTNPSDYDHFKNVKNFNLKVFGKHNQYNAMMVYRLGKHLLIPEEKIISSIESFTGIGRRMELIADRDGVKVFDDYAHHPTAIKTTLHGLRQNYPTKKILVVVEPHGFKRTKALLSNYKNVFNDADTVIIGPIFRARDEVDPSITPQKLANASGHKNIQAFNDERSLIENCKLKIANSDYGVVVVMGAGKSYLWAREIAKTLPAKFSDITTFRVGGKIETYVEINSKEDVPGVVSELKKQKSQIFIIGDGSDVLVSDDYFSGTVVKYTDNTMAQVADSLIISAGKNWDEVVKFAVDHDLQGIECLSGIPGTTGAAPIQNIGAYGQEIKDVFICLNAYDMDKEKFVTFENTDLSFGYRESIFKTKDFWQRYLITSVTLKLKKNGKPTVKYESLQNYLDKFNIENPSLDQVRSAVLAIRKTKFEDPKVVGNAGSFFKNHVISTKQKEELENKYPDVKTFPFNNAFKVAAGWLIEKAGWKGKKWKSAAVSSSHALILINPNGKAKARDVYELSEKIILDVYSKFNIKLEREVQLINFAS